jgi:hypothetical protein
VEFKTTIVSGFEIVSFSYSLGVSGSAYTEWFKNGQYNLITGSGSVTNVTFAPGDVFGFRVVANYGSSIAANISNLTAVPEPASAGGWIGLGVAGLVAMRELRRRRPAPATAQA